MKRRRFSEEQIIGILKEQEAGAKVAELSRRHGISETTFYKWKSKYGGLEVSAAKRAAVVHARTVHGINERRACSIIRVDRSSVRYQSMRGDDAELRRRLRELAAERRRFGYRRLGLLLAREGFLVNRKKLLRLYREEGLKVRRRGGRKRTLGTRAPVALPDLPNQRWSLDFVSDTFTDGRRFRILVVVDDVSRECLALVADSSLSGRRVARELDRLIEQHAKPASAGTTSHPASRSRTRLPRASSAGCATNV